MNDSDNEKRERFRAQFMAHGLPKGMSDELYAWISEGQSPGGFLYAVICNSFTDVAMIADSANRRHLKEWAMFMHSGHVPGLCWGSPERAEAWAAHHGLRDWNPTEGQS
jgi:hypothetical protein